MENRIFQMVAITGSILWNSATDVIKSSNTAFTLIKNIENWSGEVCNCSICMHFGTLCNCNIIFCYLVFISFPHQYKLSQHPTVDKMYYYYHHHFYYGAYHLHLIVLSALYKILFCMSFLVAKCIFNRAATLGDTTPSSYLLLKLQFQSLQPANILADFSGFIR